MILDLVVNWRMKLFVTLLFLTALQSCNLERTNLYSAFWLEQRCIQGTSRQVAKKEIRLPDWYLRLYFILSLLRSLVKIEKAEIISRLSSLLILGGAFCIGLGIMLKGEQMKDKIQNCILLASLEDNSSIIRVAVAVSTKSIVNPKPIRSMMNGNTPVGIEIPSETIEKAGNELATELTVSPPKQICGTSEKVPSIIVEIEQATDEKLVRCRQEIIPKTAPTEKRKGRKPNKNAIGYPPTIEKQMKKFYRTLSEKDKRRYAGVEAMKLGRSGIVYIANVLGCDRKTVSKGIGEVKKMTKRHFDQKRIRKKGGGRKPYREKNPEIDRQFLEVLQDYTAGDPMRENVIWTNLKPSMICWLLANDQNVLASRTVVYQLLDLYGYRRRQLVKNKTMKEVANRNLQFENIFHWIALYKKGPNPIMSMDSKKREKLGTFYRNGHVYTTEALSAYDHDFGRFANGVVIPHGLYDMKQNKGYMHLGTSHDTSEFACDCIRVWWLKYGQYDYPDADSILILCDGGGSNGSSHYIFKQDLQDLVNEIGIEIRIAHYPSYCSKWNPIEHKLFPHVTRACEGVIFENVELVKELMENTRTSKGLEVEVEIMDKFYELGRKASNDFKQNMGILFDELLPKWNYRVVPSGEVI